MAKAAPAATCGGGVVTIDPDGDSYVSSADGGVNYGGSETLLVGNFYQMSTYRAYLHFDLTDVPAQATIQQARLRLHVYTTYGGFKYDMGAYRPQAGWAENTLTWNNQPALAATGITTTVDSIAQWFQWDVTALAQDWLAGGENHGLAVRSVDEDFESAHEFDSREASQSWSEPPQLVITYTVPGWTVNTVADDMSECSLRRALTNARAGDSIQFDPAVFPPAAPATIQLAAALPQVDQGQVIIDGRGAGVILDGSNLPAGTPGLVLASDSNTVTGLQIRNMPGSGIRVLGNGNAIGNGSARDVKAMARVAGLPAAPANVINSNGGHGISLQGHNNVVQGNYIGTDATGSLARPNGNDGIYVGNGAKNNQIGGNAAGQGNLISGNAWAGVEVATANTSGNRIQGNIIGADINGANALANGGNGVEIHSAADGNIVGGDQAGAGNLISGNGDSGVYLGGVISTTVQGNLIGADAGGSSALANDQNGIVLFDAAQNLIGGPAPGLATGCSAACNLVSGNTGSGIVLSGSGSHDNVIVGNAIGVTAAGNAALANSGSGVLIGAGAHDNWVGAEIDTGKALAVQGNVLSGNLGAGVLLSGQDVRFNTVIGNVIGLDAGSVAAVGNHYGVELQLGPQENRIGGTIAGWPNVIAGNSSHGVYLFGSETAKNTVVRNFIGTNAAGLDYAGNGAAGVRIEAGAYENVVGDSGGSGNVIVHNLGSGVSISSARDNSVTGNRIGLLDDGSPLGNFGHGVEIANGSTDNQTTDNIITANQGDGVRVADTGSTGNTISQNSIFDNNGKGIETMDGGNLELAPPHVTDLDDLGGGNWRIAGTTCANCTVEVFSDDGVEGEVFEASVQATAGGLFTVNSVGRTANYFALTATDTAGNTSEFAATDNLSITALEVTQAVQSLNNGVTLIAGKRAYARLHVQSTLSPVPRVTAWLDGWRDGAYLGGLTPTGAGCPAEITVRPDPDRGQLDHSFCFRLPLDWTDAGRLRLVGQVNPGNRAPETNFADNEWTEEVDFVDSPAFNVDVFRVSYREGMRRRWRFPRSGSGLDGFTDRDGLSAGDVDGDGRAEILVARDQDGRVDVWGYAPASRAITVETSFDGNFTRNDAIAAGNVDNDAAAEVLIAGEVSGRVDVFQWNGATLVAQASFDGDFTAGDSFAVGDVLNGDGLDEILVAGDVSGRVDVFQWDGATWANVSSFLTGFSAGDDFAVGDVLDGDGRAEVVMAHDQNGLVDVYQWSGAAWVNVATFDGDFTPNDRLAVGDVDGDTTGGVLLAEILVAGDGCECVDVFKRDDGAGTWRWVSRFDGLGGGVQVFARGDGFAVGDVNGNGLADAITANDDDNQVEVFEKAKAGAWRLIEAPQTHVDYLESYLRRAYPFADIRLDVDRLDYPWDKGTPNAGEVTDVIKARLGLGGGEQGVTPAYGMINDIAGFMRGLGLGGSRTAAGPTGCTRNDPGCEGVARSRWDSDGIYGDWYGAHEIGHTIGQVHIKGATATRSCNSGAVVYPGGIIGGPAGAIDRFYGFDVGDTTLGLPERIYPGPAWYDFMTYCPNQWVSDYTTDNIRNQVTNRPTALASKQAGDFLFFSGNINLTRGRGRIGAMYTLDGATPTSLPVSSTVTLRLESASGSLLAGYPLDVEPDSEAEPGDDELVFFSEIVPFPAGTATLSFLHQETVVMSRTVSANPPSVTLVSPNGGEVLTDTVTVQWQAEDLDAGDELHVAVLYSADRGTSWQVLVAEWPQTSYAVDTARLPGSTMARFRVVANDGVHSAQDDSDGDVVVPFRPPAVRIDWPPAESSFALSQTVLLSGWASDPDGLLIADSGFAWSSSLGGSLGTGPELMLDSLAAGTHTITLQVTDAGGLTGDDSIRIFVGTCVLQADVNRDGGVDAADVIAEASRWGQTAGVPYDQDHDGVITVGDILRVAAGWGESCS